jgi:hypothetical protein
VFDPQVILKAEIQTLILLLFATVVFYLKLHGWA